MVKPIMLSPWNTIEYSLSIKGNQLLIEIVIWKNLWNTTYHALLEVSVHRRHIWLFANPWTVARQAPLSVGFFRKNTGLGIHSLLQGNFLTQGLNLGLLHCGQILYHLSHHGVLPCTAYLLLCSSASWQLQIIPNLIHPFYQYLGFPFGEGNGNPLQYSCLENPTDGGACWAAIYGVAQSQTRLMWLSSSRLSLSFSLSLSLSLSFSLSLSLSLFNQLLKVEIVSLNICWDMISFLLGIWHI